MRLCTTSKWAATLALTAFLAVIPTFALIAYLVFAAVVDNEKNIRL
jgi:uncharacterized membrane protein YjgN (DUF898 family)